MVGQGHSTPEENIVDCCDCIENEDINDNVQFIQEAFGFNTCCNISSWTLVFTFSKMVYSCCIVLLLTFALMIISRGKYSSSEDTYEFWSWTLEVVGLFYLLMCTMMAFFASRLFTTVAELQGKTIPAHMRKDLILYSILKFISNVSFLPSMHRFFGTSSSPSSSSTMDIGLNTLATTFIICDTSFFTLYAIIVSLFLRSRHKLQTAPFDSTARVIPLIKTEKSFPIV